MARLAEAHADPGEQAQPIYREPSKRWTPETRAEVARLYEDGLSMMAIERLTGHGDDAIKRSLAKQGVPIRGSVPKLTESMLRDAVTRNQAGETFSALARRYRVNRSSLVRALQRRGLLDK